jgi:hypothetical protein
LRMRIPQIAKRSNVFQQAHGKPLISKALKIEWFRNKPESALGAGGRAFESPRPDQ